MHTGTDTAAPAERGVAKSAGEVPILEEALRLELVGFGEILLVEVNCRGVSKCPLPDGNMK